MSDRNRQPAPEENVEAQVARAAERLRAGGLVAFPTETVYGLGALALSEAAVQRVFRVKGRPGHNPLIVHVSGESMARGLARDWPSEASRLARVMWPGPLTIVVPRADVVPALVTAGGPNVALRCPDHPLTLALLYVLNQPLVGPSANKSGNVSPTSAAHVRDEFGPFDETDPDSVMVLETRERLRVGVESTVVSLVEFCDAGRASAGREPRALVLRRGMVTPGEIASALGIDGSRVEVLDGASADPSKPLDSPGRLSRHYAPRTPVALLTRDALMSRLAREKSPVVVLGASLEVLECAGPHRVISMPIDPDEYGAALYSALREADRQSASAILVEWPVVHAEDLTATQQAKWSAIGDRLVRAATPA